ncbi:replication initiation protein [Candidatus Phytoplasma meliae]|uniref:Replication initiation protein n=1 Tax=Candidatus Phytoplasma meliae TaxID=1848402 RepID=A0ABS5CYB8_9MOLU|nr:replication initiation protein [Candidatus Phytoplasma meliae]MBP5835965.1 replication initiation protein [Candidatus Phytoplasma meliae]
MSSRLHLFQIQNQIFLTLEEQRALNLLYQPLIGPQALGIYNILLSLKNHYEYQHQFLFDLGNISENVFYEAQTKLEALRLLSTYQSQDAGANQNKKSKIYFLIAPYKFQDFLQDPLLSDFLLSEIGEKHYFKLQNHFLPENGNLEGFKDISKNFTDVYQFQKINFNQSLLNKNENMSNSPKMVLKTNFDYELFLKHLPERFKKPFLIEWKTIDFIQKLSLVYNLTPKKMADMYQKTFLNANDIDLLKLRLNVKKNNHQSNSDQKIVSSRKIGNDDQEMISFLKKANSTQRIIKDYCQKNIQSMASDTVFQLLERNDLELGLVNALLIYILRYREGILPSVVYLEKTLQSWAYKGIIDTETAYDFLVENKVQNQSDLKKSSNKPKWIDNMKKNWQS